MAGAGSMEPNCLDAFRDRGIAIAIALLVLKIVAPRSDRHSDRSYSNSGSGASPTPIKAP